MSNCGAREQSSISVNQFPMKPCRMARNMVCLHYGKERGMYANERGGVRPTLEGTWLATLTTPEGRQGIYLRTAGYRKGDICLFNRQLVRSTTRGCLRENQASLWPVTASRQSFVVSQATNESLVSSRYLLLILRRCATFGNIKQHLAQMAAGR
jgi:hypothetical protein